MLSFLAATTTTAGTDICSDTNMKAILGIVQIIYRLIQIGVPILLIILGSIDLGKAVIAGKEDEIKKNQQVFLKRVIAAVLVFLVATIVSLVFSVILTNVSGTADWSACWKVISGS